MTVPRPRFLLFLAATTSVLACASTTTQGRERGAQNVLTGEQLAATNTDNLFEAINKLRPTWLTSRGPVSVTDATPTTVSVFSGSSYLGKADYLQTVRILEVTEVKYWDPASASARFGMGHPRGVIELTRK